MNQVSLNDMSREEWLAWRRKGIGSSDAAAIMGVSPWATPFQAWEDKVLGTTKEDNSAMKRGRDYEEEARQWFTKQTGLLVKPKNIVSPIESWIRASFDGITEDLKHAVEIKVPGREDHLTASQGKVPAKYMPQMQHQFQVQATIQVNFYVSYDPNAKEGIILERSRDNDYINDLLFPAEKAFWDCVLSETPPPLTDRDYMNMEGDALWREFLNNAVDLKERELKDKELREKIQMKTGNLSCKGFGATFTKTLAKGAIDYKMAMKDYVDNLRKRYPEIDFQDIPVEPYRKSSYLKWVLRGI